MKIGTVQNIDLYNEISSLPKELKEEVLLFVAFLKQKKSVHQKPKERNYGNAKGKFVMAKDFDEPLEDLKDYM